MHPSAGRRRRRANIDTLSRCRVRYRPDRRTCEELPEILHPAIDIATNVIRIILLKLKRVRDMPSQDAITEARRKALNLSFDPLRHVERRTVRNMAIRPQGLLPLRCACQIKQALLCNQHKGLFRRFALPYRGLGSSNLCQRATDMDCSCAYAFLSFPWHRPIKRKIYFEHSWTVA